MKTILLLLISCSTFAQPLSKRVILAEFKDECIIWSDATTISNSLSTVPKGDSCIVIQYLKPAVGAEWVKIISADTIGYVMVSFLNFPDGALYELMHEKDFKERNSLGLLFIENKRNSWFAWKEKLMLENEKIRLDEERVRAEYEQIVEEKSKQELKALEAKLKSIKTELSKYSVIIDYSFSQNIIDYPDFYVTVLNCNLKKTIKYVWFNITGYNPVNDAEGKKTVKGVGPIKPFDRGKYNFESVFLSKVVDRGKINSVKIQYMDETVITITGNQIESDFRKARIALEKLREGQAGY